MLRIRQDHKDERLSQPFRPLHEQLQLPSNVGDDAGVTLAIGCHADLVFLSAIVETGNRRVVVSVTNVTGEPLEDHVI